jgi:phenylacetate-CoA ligase
MTSTVRPFAPDASSRTFEPDIETMPRHELEALQGARLREQLLYVYERSPLLRSVWDDARVDPRDIRTTADFVARAPFIDKDSIRSFRDRHRDPFGGLLCAQPAELQVLGSSSGTSGDPTPLPQEPCGPMVRGLSRDFWEAGARPGDRVAFMLFTFRSGFALERFEQIGLVPIFLDPLPAEAGVLLDAMRRLGPKLLYLLNNPMILAISEHVEATKADVREAFASVRTAFFGGEPMSEFSRARLEEWGPTVHTLSTLGDICTAVECRERDGFHAWEDLVLTESLQPDGVEPVGDRERGELVVTSLAERAAPFVRYRSGDIVQLTREACGCGRTHARFTICGRKSDEVVVGGRSILPRDVWPAVESVAATSNGLFQIIRRARTCDVLELRVGYRGSPPLPALAAEVTDAVSADLGVHCAVDLVPEQALLALGPPHKIPRVSET